MDKNKTVCPWCDTEIIWDEEFGPEDQCPYCDNELRDYRTSFISDVTQKAEASKIETELSLTGREARESLEESMDSGIDALLADVDQEDTDMYNYEQKIKSLQQEQADIIECTSCHEVMVTIGSAKLSEAQFNIHPAFEGGIAVPFETQLYVCPACYQLKWTLTNEDRLSIIHHLSKG